MVEDGVGMSYIHGGKLFRPSNMGGFELGHMTVDADGPVCRCRNRGCLGTVTSEDYIVQEYNMKSGGLDRELTLQDIVILSNQGDDIARQLLMQQANILGIGIVNILNMFNPELIVIGGPLNQCTWNYLDIVLKKEYSMGLDVYRDNVNIKYTSLGSRSAIMGMANDIFERKIFKPVEI